MADEECQVTFGERQVSDEECQVTLGESQVSDGECQVTLGESQVSDGECQVSFGERQMPDEEFPLLSGGFLSANDDSFSPENRGQSSIIDSRLILRNRYCAWPATSESKWLVDFTM